MRFLWAIVLGFGAASSAIAAPVPTTSDADDALVRRLIEALSDSDLDVRLNISYALAKIGPPSIEPLVAALKDSDVNRRASAAYTLGLIGSPARLSMPALLSVLSDSDVEVRRQAAYAIGRLIPSRPASADAKRAALPAPSGAKP